MTFTRKTLPRSMRLLRYPKNNAENKCITNVFGNYRNMMSVAGISYVLH